MSRARELSMGARRNRPQANADMVALRRLMRAPDESFDCEAAAELVKRIGAARDRLRYADGMAYTECVARLRALGIDVAGPTKGTY